MLPYQVIDGGSFTSSAVAKKQVVQLSDEPDLIWLRNRTNWGDDSQVLSVESYWRRGMDRGLAQAKDQEAGGALTSAAVASNGFRVYNTQSPPVFQPKDATSISNVDPSVVAMADTGEIEPGDVVRLVNTTGMLQVSGYDFEVNAVTPNTSVTLNFDGSGEAAAASAGDVRLFVPNKMYPRRRFIVPLAGAAGITQAAKAVVSLSVSHDFTVGEKVRLKVPKQYGMFEANGKLASVLSVTQYTVTLDLDTSGFSPFALPDSLTYSDGVSPAQLLPAGAGPEDGANPPGVPVDAAFDNRNQWVLSMGTNVITKQNAVYDWVAYRFDRYKAL